MKKNSREQQMYRTPGEKMLEKSRQTRDAAFEQRETPLQILAGCAIGLAGMLACIYQLLPIEWIAMLGCSLSVLARCVVLRAADEAFQKAFAVWCKGAIVYIVFAALFIALFGLTDWLPESIGVSVLISYALALLPASGVITPILYLLAEFVG